MAACALDAIQEAGLTKDQVEWIGIGTPGIANSATGIIEYSNNLDFHDVPMVKWISEATGLHITRFLSGSQGGDQQIAARIAFNEIDMLIFLRDPLDPTPHEPNDMNLLRLCDMHNIPVATNIATAESLVRGLERGDLDWRALVK